MAFHFDDELKFLPLEKRQLVYQTFVQPLLKEKIDDLIEEEKTQAADATLQKNSGTVDEALARDAEKIKGKNKTVPEFKDLDGDSDTKSK